MKISWPISTPTLKNRSAIGIDSAMMASTDEPGTWIQLSVEANSVRLCATVNAVIVAMSLRARFTRSTRANTNSR